MNIVMPDYVTGHGSGGCWWCGDVPDELRAGRLESRPQEETSQYHLQGCHVHQLCVIVLVDDGVARGSELPFRETDIRVEWVGDVGLALVIRVDSGLRLDGHLYNALGVNTGGVEEGGDGISSGSTGEVAWVSA